MKSGQTNHQVVQLSGVSKIFGSDENKTIALHPLSIEAQAGELMIVAGPSGSGKTTLLTLIAGLLRPTSGLVSLFGKNLEDFSPPELQRLRARKIGFIFQTFHLIDSFSALENVALVLHFSGMDKTSASHQAFQLLKQLHIEHLAKKFPPTLSQGEKQRVAVARALANGAPLIIADEPTSSLESKQGFEIVDLLHQSAKKEGRCVFIASHDLRLLEYADRVIHLQDGMLQPD
jgi:putative ABC transport system ATP-binding protein